MKRILFSLFCLFLLAGFLAANVSAAAGTAARQDTAPKFSLGNLSPSAPYPGEKVTVKVTYPPDFQPLPEGTPVQYIVTYTSPDLSGEASCPGDCIFPLSSSGISEIDFYAPPKESSYSLTVTLTAGKDAAPQKLEIKTLTVESALPSSLGQLFAGLGLFAAVMAIMALGTEVVIEFGKFFLGLKAKVTALEAFNELQKELPGQLSSLGVDNQTIHKLDSLFQGVTATLDPLAQAASVDEKIRAGMFAEAYEAVKEIEALKKLGSNNPTLVEKLEALKAKARSGVASGMTTLENTLPLRPDIIVSMKVAANQAIDKITPDTLGSAVKNLLTALQTVLFQHEPEWTKKWVVDQATNLAANTEKEIFDFATANIFNPLLELGFDPECVIDLRNMLVDKLGQARGLVLNDANIYANSIKNLLQAVEDQRNKYQSPARKIWRRLRESSLPLWIAAVLSGAGYAVIWIIQSWGRQPVNSLLSAALLWGTGIGEILALVMYGAQYLFAGREKAGAAGVLDQYGTLGYFLRFVLERGFNYLMGRRSSMVEALSYGEVDQDAQDAINNISPVTVAKTLLDREEKHQDEEVSRVRMIRVLSLLIGTYLAYHLRIDAAEYLNFAVPGIAGQINAVNINLSSLWSVLPRDLTVGVILTGLAASAGSKFWRDLLGRLQSTRDQAEEAARQIRNIRGTISDITGK